MILVLREGASEADRAKILADLRGIGLEGRALLNGPRTLVHVIKGPTRSVRRLLGNEVIEALIPTSGPRIRRYGRRFYPYHLIGWAAGSFLAVGVLVFLAGYLPPGVGLSIDPDRPAESLAPPWYLRALDRYLELVPPGLGWLLLALLALALFLLPVLDRANGRGARDRWPVLLLGLLVILGVVALSWMGGP